MSAGRAARDTSRATNLHLLPDWEGGIRRWLQLFAKADRRSRNLALVARGTNAAYGLELALLEASDWTPLERFSLQRPVSELAVESAELRGILESVIGAHGVEHLYVSNLIGQSLDALDMDLPTTLVWHDYFPFCVGLNLFFEAPCQSCDNGRLQTCLLENPHSRPFRHNSTAHWQRVRERYFELLQRRRPTQVVPLAGMAENVRRVDGRFGDLTFTVIEHGLDVEPSDCFGGSEGARRLRLLVMGRLNAPKGLASLRSLLPRLTRLADVILLGGGDAAAEFLPLAGVRVIADYMPNEIPGWLARLRPDAALFLSEVPETYSFTLSEIRLCGIPPIARRLGAFTERIAHRRTGLHFDNADECVALVKQLDGNRHVLHEIAQRLRGEPARTADAMVADYYALRGAEERSRRAPHLRAL